MTLTDIGLVYHNLSQYFKALEFYQQALVITEKVAIIDQRAGAGAILNNIGGVYRDLGQYPKALQFYEQALAVDQKFGQKPGEGATLANIGFLLNKLGNYANAEEKLFNAIAILDSLRPGLSDDQKVSIFEGQANARIIHLATHGLLDDFKGLGVPGAIALAPDGTGELNDGLLTASEILDLKLNAELVVLSACDTGRGKLTGDGVIGLSRSLITAGVPSVIVSLWSVPDAPTASLMTQFYQNLQNNPDKAIALRQAMLTTMETHPNPRDWAAFTFIGEAQ